MCSCFQPHTGLPSGCALRLHFRHLLLVVLHRYLRLRHPPSIPRLLDGQKCHRQDNGTNVVTPGAYEIHSNNSGSLLLMDAYCVESSTFKSLIPTWCRRSDFGGGTSSTTRANPSGNLSQEIPMMLQGEERTFSCITWVEEVLTGQKLVTVKSDSCVAAWGL